MNPRIKSVSSLSFLVLLGLSLACESQAAPERHKADTDQQMQACIKRIARHADYDDASRVVHRVTSLRQKNPIELEFRIETAVFVHNDDQLTRQYSASCVTAFAGKVIRFRIESTAQ